MFLMYTAQFPMLESFLKSVLFVLKESPRQMMMPSFNLTFHDTFFFRRGARWVKQRRTHHTEMMKNSFQQFAMKGAGFVAILDIYYIYIYQKICFCRC